MGSCRDRIGGKRFWFSYKLKGFTQGGDRREGTLKGRGRLQRFSVYVKSKGLCLSGGPMGEGTSGKRSLASLFGLSKIQVGLPRCGPCWARSFR